MSKQPATREQNDLLNHSTNASAQTLPATGAANSSAATSVRWRIMGIVMLIMAVTALNRLNLSIAGKTIEEEFAFNTIKMGSIFSAFLWGYALFQIPWGYICDRLGPMRTLTASILFFGFGAGMMGVAPRLAASAGLSILLGVSGDSFLHRRRRSRRLAKLRPRHRLVDQPEGKGLCQRLAKRRPRPRGNSHSHFHRLVDHTLWLANASVWGLILAYGCQGYAFYVYYNWFYFYAVKVRGLQMMEAAAWTSAPFLAMALLSPIGGWFSDRLSRRSGRRKGRIWAVWLGMGISALLLVFGSHLTITAIALPMIALAAGFNYFATSNFWASCIDLAPDFSASLSALMNTVGNIGGAISSTATAYLAVHQGWSRALDVAALITVGSGLLFSVVNAGRTIEEKSAESLAQH